MFILHGRLNRLRVEAKMRSKTILGFTEPIVEVVVFQHLQ